jgi:hypothetical protein
MTVEISCSVLVAANDRGAGTRVALGMVVDVEAAVMVYAATPRGRYFEFTAHANLAPVSAILESRSKTQ